jgi:hypothetical protein
MHTLVMLLMSLSVSFDAFAEYKIALQEASRVQRALAEQYQQSANDDQRQAVLSEAGQKLHQLLVDELFPHWYGTDWDYSGMSEQPGEGSIACGYFVTTLLRDAGVNLERIRLAQQASEIIIKSLVQPNSIKRYSNTQFESFLNSVNSWGQGIYIVGLDIHVGFISVESEGTYFIHSSYQSPYSVVKEIASESNILASSQYRVLGKLDDATFIQRWVEDRSI